MNTLLKNSLLAPLNLLYRIAPQVTLQILFRLKQGYRLSLEHPKTFNEKLQWIKLNDRNPLMAKCCDKYLVRKYVEDLGLVEILNELYWSGFDPDDIPFDSLPEKFVIKATHGSTFNMVIDDSHKLDRDFVRAECRRWLSARFLPCYGEWFYGVWRPRIIVEKYLEEPNSGQLYDYKVFVMNGAAQYIRLDTDRYTSHKNVVYGPDWTEIPGVHMGFEIDERSYDKPACLAKLVDAAEQLAEPFTHARVDFYIVNEEPIFGELTFTNGAGFDRFSSYAFDLEMGQKLRLPTSNLGPGESE